MKWGRRIRLYLIGFGIGLFIVWLLFLRNGGRDYGGWLPSSRVTKLIFLAKQINADSTLVCRLKCEGITLEDIRKAAPEGEVDFDKSQPRKEPHHEYDVKMTVKGKTLDVYFETNMTDSIVKVLLVDPLPDGAKCGCK
jgi:hypothetical protein